MRDWQARLDLRREQGLYRHRQTLESPQGARIQLDGRSCANFCSNDYLGLASHPEVIETLRRAACEMGVGGGASHLVCGHHQAHHDLEQALASFTGREAALLFSSGYMANLGVLGALAERGDTVFHDRLNHASLLDGTLLGRARLRRYPHADAAALDSLLTTNAAADSSSRQQFVVTDGVFSMDGDMAPLDALARTARRHDALLIVDDAHGFGVQGQDGRGTVDHFGLDSTAVPLLIGTLGKAFGTAGAFVAGSQPLIDYLLQHARSYTYTTAMPPAIAAATLTSLRLAEQESWRREHLAALVKRFREETAGMGYSLMPSASAIQPLLVGDSRLAVEVSNSLLQRGVAVSAIRPPTVPTGSARLRVTFSAAHTQADLDQLLAALAAERHRLRPPAAANDPRVVVNNLWS